MRISSRLKQKIKKLLPAGRKITRRRKLIRRLTVGLIVWFLIIFWLVAAPLNFKADTVVRVPSGVTSTEAADILQAENIIRHPQVFIFLTRLAGGETGIIAGHYYFKRPPTVWTVSKRLMNGDFDVEPVRVTLPEGLTVRDMAVVLDRQLPFFDSDRFIALADTEEGFLFPDTYFFSSFATEEEIVKEMRRNFDRQIADLLPDIDRSPRTLREIVIMASILEKEARTTESRKIIAGILWKRIDNGMRLQVDAVFPYIIGKNTFELSREDLRYDSPYNTYRYEGLPPGAIANPSRNSIEAALYPQSSPFWYYLSDMTGEMHYAIEHDDHVRNKNRYLR
ncbi:MAG: endolytic transglycosylase MltG [Candidatus Paceibacterota bacterium]